MFSPHISKEMIDRNVKKELAQLLLRGAIRANVFIITASVLIYFSLQSVIPARPLASWAVLMCLLAAVRFRVSVLFQKTIHSKETHRKFVLSYMWLTAIIGGSWGLLPLLPDAFSSVFSQAFILFIMIGMLFVGFAVLSMN